MCVQYGGCPARGGIHSTDSARWIVGVTLHPGGVSTGRLMKYKTVLKKNYLKDTDVFVF